jgi:hypothetical protein
MTRKPYGERTTPPRAPAVRDPPPAGEGENVRSRPHNAIRVGVTCRASCELREVLFAIHHSPLAFFFPQIKRGGGIAQTISEYRKLALDADAAIEFVRGGPHGLEELQVSEDYEEFSSYPDFVKGTSYVDLVAKRFGPAGDGSQYHHIVTQGGANASNIAPEQLQSTDNIIRLPTLLHEAVNAEYFRFDQKLGMTNYQWLQTQPYDVQRESGLRILRELHILK